MVAYRISTFLLKGRLYQALFVGLAASIPSILFSCGESPSRGVLLFDETQSTDYKIVSVAADSHSEKSFVEFSFSFRNNSMERARILAVRVGCGCTSVEFPEEALEPQEGSTIVLSVDPSAATTQTQNVVVQYEVGDRKLTQRLSARLPDKAQSLMNDNTGPRFHPKSLRLDPAIIGEENRRFIVVTSWGTDCLLDLANARVESGAFHVSVERVNLESVTRSAAGQMTNLTSDAHRAVFSVRFENRRREVPDEEFRLNVDVLVIPSQDDACGLEIGVVYR